MNYNHKTWAGEWLRASEHSWLKLDYVFGIRAVVRKTVK